MWAWSRRRLRLSIGGGAARRRRAAQYSARAGSSGDAPALTIWCRMILVQACLTR